MAAVCVRRTARGTRPGKKKERKNRPGRCTWCRLRVLALVFPAVRIQAVAAVRKAGGGLVLARCAAVGHGGHPYGGAGLTEAEMRAGESTEPEGEGSRTNGCCMFASVRRHNLTFCSAGAAAAVRWRGCWRGRAAVWPRCGVGGAACCRGGGWREAKKAEGLTERAREQPALLRQVSPRALLMRPREPRATRLDASRACVYGSWSPCMRASRPGAPAMAAQTGFTCRRRERE